MDCFFRLFTSDKHEEMWAVSLLLDSTVFMNSIPFLITEIARQAAQIKLLRKLQKQEQARAAKEAKKQQGKYQTCENLCVLED